MGSISTKGARQPIIPHSRRISNPTRTLRVPATFHFCSCRDRRCSPCIYKSASIYQAQIHCTLDLAAGKTLPPPQYPSADSFESSIPIDGEQGGRLHQPPPATPAAPPWLDQPQFPHSKLLPPSHNPVQPGRHPFRLPVLCLQIQMGSRQLLLPVLRATNTSAAALSNPRLGRCRLGRWRELGLSGAPLVVRRIRVGSRLVVVPPATTPAAP